MGRWVRSGLSGSTGFAVGVAGFVAVCLVRPGAPLGSLGWFGFVWFVQVRPWGDWVQSGSSSMALRIAGFDWVPLVCLCVPCGSLGSLEFVWLVRVRHGGCWVRSGSFGLSRCALGVVELV